MDEKKDFQNAKSDDKTFSIETERFVVDSIEDHLYVVQNALYGLNKASKKWQNRLKAFIMDKCFVSSWKDS